jgi:hypothetical protein
MSNAAAAGTGVSGTDNTNTEATATGGYPAVDSGGQPAAQIEQGGGHAKGENVGGGNSQGRGGYVASATDKTDAGGTGPGSRRSSRRDERFHPYR